MIMKMDFIGSCSFARVILQKNEMVTTIAVTAYNVGVFKPTVHDLSNSSN